MRMDRDWLQNSVDLFLRRTVGRTFQEFFGKVMSAKHGDGFVPTTADYTHGDCKCDGLLWEPLTIFACYGPVNAGHDQSVGTVQSAADKVIDDFEGALKKWPSMQAWTFVTSYPTMPSHFVDKIRELKAKYPHITIELFGMERFVKVIEGFDDDLIYRLIGTAALKEAVKHLRAEEVLAVVNKIMELDTSGAIVGEPPKPVPERKIEFNLTGRRAEDLKEAYANAPQVAAILKGDPNPTLQMRVAAVFKTRYDELEAQQFTPGIIFDKLIELGMSGENYDTDRHAAALSVVAYLFELCTIFKEPPGEEAA